MIMKKTLKLLAALALIIFVGCTKELVDDSANQAGPEVKPDEEPVANTTVTIDLPSDESAVAPSGISVKTSLGSLEEGVRKIYWCEDDKISINGNASTLMTNLSDDKRSATFEFAGAVLEYPYSVLYPAEMYKDEQTITLLAVQPSADDSFADDAVPMAAYQAEAGKIALKHLVGVVRLQIKLPAENPHNIHPLSKVEFRGNNGEQVSGDFTVDYESATLTGASSADADKVVVAKVGKALPSDNSINVFVAVPAISYANGFTVRLVDAAGHYMDIASKTVTIEKGEIKAMPIVNFVPTGTIVDADLAIANAADLLKFADDYNNGVYSNTEFLRVRLSNNIEFDAESSAAWMSIGKSGNWFRGTFDGGNFSIKGLTSSRPLFYGTSSDGYVQNLILDESCTLTADFIGEMYYGGFVGYHTGLLQNCHSKADVAVSGKWAVKYGNVGGLVGRIAGSGKVDGCSMTGNVSADKTFVVEGTTYLAGLVGCIAETTGSIVNSDFTGSLTTNGGANDDNIAYVGGITGLAGGLVDGCTTAADGTVHAEYAEAGVKTYYVGGVAGNVKEGGSLTKCVNNSVVYFKYPRTTTPSAYVGGVTGAIAKEVSLTSCENKNAVHSYSDAQNLYIAGVVGNAVAGSIVDNCHNRAAGEVKVMSYGAGSNGARYLYHGGIIGSCATSNVSNVSNAGLVEMNCVENSSSTMVNVGGCIGVLTAALDGNNTITNTITNSGTVTATDASTSRSYLSLGGVVGTINAANANLSKVLNTGNVTDAVTVLQKNAFSGGVVGLVRQPVTIENVKNEGKIHFSNATGSSQLHVNVGLGGVVGGISALKNNDFAVIVRNSTNSGEVSRVATAAAQKSSSVCGGIVGILKGTGSSVTGCTNSGLIKNEALNSTTYDDSFDPLASDGSGQAAGGIVGFVLGASADAVMVSNCTNSGECYTARGYVGGVVGYARSAKITGCRHKTALVSGAASYARVGGIAGHISGVAVTDCHLENATVDGMSQGNTGGIAGAMSSKATVENSTVIGIIDNSVKVGRSGAIVGYSLAEVTITNCGAKGKIGNKSTLEDITTAKFDGNSKATTSGSYILQ